jgi:hypothetical protein
MMGASVRGFGSAGLFAAAWLVVSALIAAPARADVLSVQVLLADCQASAAKCNDHFMSGELMEVFMSIHCMPDNRLKAQAEIVAWLSRHPEEQSKDAEDGVRDAAAALWTCDDGN